MAWVRELLSNRIQCVAPLLLPASDPGDYLQTKRRWAWQVGVSSWSVANGLFSIFSSRLFFLSRPLRSFIQPEKLFEMGGSACSDICPAISCSSCAATVSFCPRREKSLCLVIRVAEKWFFFMNSNATFFTFKQHECGGEQNEPCVTPPAASHTLLSCMYLISLRS